jgi:hypothetical protein
LRNWAFFAEEHRPTCQKPSISSSETGQHNAFPRAIGKRHWAEIAFWEGIGESSMAVPAYLEISTDASVRSPGRVGWLDDPSPSTEDELKIELAFWESVRESSDHSFIQAYIEEFPEGQFVGLRGSLSNRRVGRHLRRLESC